MQTLDQCLMDLMQKGVISRQDAQSKAQNKEQFI